LLTVIGLSRHWRGRAHRAETLQAIFVLADVALARQRLVGPLSTGAIASSVWTPLPSSILSRR
jgi:hypothetical protein